MGTEETAIPVSASDAIKWRILEAFFNNPRVEDESHRVSARGELQELIGLIQKAAAEWVATKAKSVSIVADALDSAPINLCLWAACSSKASLVGPEGLEPSTRGLKDGRERNYVRPTMARVAPL
ncbi:hypothetical protein M3667_14190 [Microbacterium sp. P26]|uniref:hypothetical protein n=1 Tax=Microbacterium TaxID=33882 RepID=UPI0020408B07|nr:hypothetical protein [Microbacterium sp. P26]MCM3503018.1 hypothetical protein [Microbacterium sp. P26]